MKKILIMMLTAIMALGISSCGNKNENKETTTGQVQQEENNINAQTEADTEKQEDEAKPTTDSSASSNSTGDKQWKQFLKEYEAWVDNYVKILKKYKANPSDMTILSDYTDMMTELSEWQAKTDEVQAELESASPQEVAEYTKELSRIINKMTAVE